MEIDRNKNDQKQKRVQFNLPIGIVIGRSRDDAVILPPPGQNGIQNSRNEGNKNNGKGVETSQLRSKGIITESRTGTSEAGTSGTKTTDDDYDSDQSTDDDDHAEWQQLKQNNALKFTDKPAGPYSPWPNPSHQLFGERLHGTAAVAGKFNGTRTAAFGEIEELPESDDEHMGLLHGLTPSPADSIVSEAQDM